MFWGPRCWLEVKQGDGGRWRYYARSLGAQMVDGTPYAANEIVAQESVGQGQETALEASKRGRAAMRGWRVHSVDYVAKKDKNGG